MTAVALKTLDFPPSPDGYVYFDLITFMPGGPLPPRLPPIGGGPVDPNRPHPEHPISGPPGFGPGHGFPDRPGYPTIPELPKPPEIPEGKLVYIFQPPAGETPPAAPPADAEVLKVKYADGGTGWAWFAPHIAPQP